MSRTLSCSQRATKLILKCGYSPGDVVLLTAAVRDLHLQHPGRFISDIRTSCPEIWEHNPYITPIQDDDPDAKVIDCWYPLINKSNEAPYHSLHGFTEFLSEKLDVCITPTAFKGDIHLSSQEKAWFSQVHEVTGKDIPFWIVAAGGKYDITIKWWETSRYQEVIDRLREKIQFVQVGAPGHHHPKLNGVIDLRGETNLRQLIRLVYHSQGVLCSVTAMMHLAAAVEAKRGNAPIRPAVVIAGGREPAHWEAYPGHQFIHTIGALSCCKDGGCWRDRIVPLRDGDPRDKPRNLCLQTVNALPKCLDMISAVDVARHIENFQEGGAIRYLTPAERKAAEKGIRKTADNRFDLQPLNLESAGFACEAAVKNLPTIIPNWHGRGIVICGGGIRYFTNAWVCINRLRRTGCRLPIEVWHLGKPEMTPQMSKLLASLGAKTIDAFQMRKNHPTRLLGGWELKPYSVFHSRFNDVLFLDADNVPVRNPEYLFETEEFKSTGAVFWPDLDHGRDEKSLAVWRSCGLRRPHEPEFESGQMLFDKSRCALPLRFCVWLNENSDFYYRYLHGDKETFHIAFRKLKKKYSLVPKPVDWIDSTMCQHDFEGRRIFQHRNMDKWDLIGNRRIQDFWFEDECRSYITSLKERWNGSLRPVPRKPFAKLGGPSAPKIAVIIFDESQDAVSQTLEFLENAGWKGIVPVVIPELNRTELNGELSESIRLSFENSPEYVLLLQGKLILNRYLFHNLANWKLLREKRIAIASLYNPRVQEFACDFANNARLASPKTTFDSPAMVISRNVADLLTSGRSRTGGIGFQVARFARKLNQPIYFHAPSLVQRLSMEDSHSFAQAADFDAQWRA
jgi:hypothetical protein